MGLTIEPEETSLKDQVAEMVDMLDDTSSEELSTDEETLTDDTDASDEEFEEESDEYEDEEEDDLDADEDPDDDEEYEDGEEASEETPDPKDAQILALTQQLNSVMQSVGDTRMNPSTMPQGQQLTTVTLPDGRQVQMPMEALQKASGQVAPGGPSKDELVQGLKDLNIFTDDELDGILDDPMLINEGMRRLGATIMDMVSSSITQAANQAAVTAAGTADQRYGVMQEVQKTTNDFYARNKDLKDAAGFVQFKFQEQLTLHQANPSATVDDVLNATEVAVRTALNRPRPKRAKGKRKKKPAMVGSKGSRKPSRGKRSLKPGSQAEQVAEMVDMLS